MSALELVLDFHRLSAIPSAVSAKESAAKDMLRLVLAQRSSRKELLIHKALKLYCLAHRAMSKKFQRRSSQLQHNFDVMVDRNRRFERQFEEVEVYMRAVRLSGPLLRQIQRLVNMFETKVIVLDRLLAARPEIAEEAQRIHNEEAETTEEEMED